MTEMRTPQTIEPDQPKRRLGDGLTSGEREALTNLASKQEGKPVGWITIADAQALTEMGLAQRSHQGWTITTEGQAAFHAMPEISRNNACDVEPFASPDR